MDWYFSKNGQQQGPIDQEALEAKIASGELSETDLVWKEGMTDWVPTTQYPAQSPNPLSSSEPTEQPPIETTSPAPFQAAERVVHPAEAKATTPLILGIISIAGLCVPFIGFFLSLITGIIAIIQGKKIKQLLPDSSPARGKAHLGWVLGLIGVILCALSLVAAILYGIAVMNNPELQEALQEILESEAMTSPDLPPTE